jgi:hypothetical protein
MAGETLQASDMEARSLMIGKRRSKVVLYIVLTASPCVVAWAQTPTDGVEPFGRPIGFDLESASRRDAGGHYFLYGGTSSNANWHFTQWNAPQDFAPLSASKNEWSAANGWAAIHVYHQNGVWRENIVQDGRNLPCLTPQGAANEFDLLIEPNAVSATSYPSGVNHAAYSDADHFPSLGQLASFTVEGVYRLDRFGRSPNATACKANHAFASYGLILTDTAVTPHQILWYSVIISSACIRATENGTSGSDYDFCNGSITKPAVWWYWTGLSQPRPNLVRDKNGVATGLNFALNDIMPSFGYRPTEDSNSHHLSFDFLKRLQELTTSGKYGIDTDLNHWRLSSVSYGQAAWGAIYMSTDWQGFVPKWMLKSKVGRP